MSGLTVRCRLADCGLADLWITERGLVDFSLLAWETDFMRTRPRIRQANVLPVRQSPGNIAHTLLLLLNL